jgi:hypothetical protein
MDRADDGVRIPAGPFEVRTEPAVKDGHRIVRAGIVKGCEIWAHAGHPASLSQGGGISVSTCGLSAERRQARQ